MRKTPEAIRTWPIYYRPRTARRRAYRRGLDIETATHTIEYTADGTTFRREYFASRRTRRWSSASRPGSPALTRARCKLADAHARANHRAGNILTAAGALANGLPTRPQFLVTTGGTIAPPTAG